MLLWHFPGLKSPGKCYVVLESPGSLLKLSNITFFLKQLGIHF